MVIDTHSHIGVDFYCGTMTLEEYKMICKEIGIDIGFLMPTPWPCMIENGQSVAQLLWEHENYVTKFYFKRQENGTNEIVKKNPYHSVNDYYLKWISKSSNESLSLFFVPLIHGVLDTPDYLESLLKNTQIPAIKIHGFGSGFQVNEIRGELIELLKYYDIPLILHTSVYHYDYGYGVDTKYFRNQCHPLLWANFLIDNHLKGVLNHGACLNKESIKLVNRHDNLMIGIGPDADLAHDYFKMDIDKIELKKIGYLKLLRKMVCCEKLLFDLDYGWNIDPKTGNLDTKQLHRLEQVWDDFDVDLITCQNAFSFFERINNKKKIKM